MRIELDIRTLLLWLPWLRLHACARDGMRVEWLVWRIWLPFLDRRVHEWRVETHLESIERCYRCSYVGRSKECLGVEVVDSGMNDRNCGMPLIEVDK